MSSDTQIAQNNLFMIKGMISEMPSERQEKIHQIVDMLRATYESDPDNTTLALGIIGLEIAIKN